MKNAKKHLYQLMTTTPDRPDFSLVERLVLYALTFFVGCCYNYMGEYYLKVGLDDHSFVHDSFARFLIDISSLCSSLSAVFSALLLVVIILSLKRFPFTTFMTISLFGQFVVNVALGIEFILFSDQNKKVYSIIFSISIVLNAICNGFFTSLNLSTFFYLASLIGPSHIASYLLGTSWGPFLSAFLHIGWNFAAETHDEDLDIDLLILSHFQLVSILLYILLFFFSPSFRVTLKQDLPAELDATESLASRTFSLLKASAAQLRETSREIVFPIISMAITIFTTNLIFPHFLTFLPFVDDTLTENDTGVKRFHPMLVKNISFIINGTNVIGNIAAFIQMYRSERTIMVLAVERALFVIIPSVITSLYGAHIFDIFYGTEVDQTLFVVVSLFVTIILILLTFFIGLSHGYLTFLSAMQFTRKIDEKISAIVLILSLMIPSFFASLLQTVATVIVRAI